MAPPRGVLGWGNRIHFHVAMAEALATLLEALKRSAARPRRRRMDRTDALRVVRARKALRRGIHRTSTRIAGMPAPPRRHRRVQRPPRASLSVRTSSSRVGESYQARVPRRATYFKPTRAIGNWPGVPTDAHRTLSPSAEAAMEAQLRGSWSSEDARAFDEAVRRLGTDLRAVKACLPGGANRSMRDVVAYFYTIWRCDEAKRRKEESSKGDGRMKMDDLEDGVDPDQLSAFWRRYYDEDEAFARSKSASDAAREAAVQKNKIATLEGMERKDAEEAGNEPSDGEAVREDRTDACELEDRLVESRPSIDQGGNGLEWGVSEEPMD